MFCKVSQPKFVSKSPSSGCVYVETKARRDYCTERGNMRKLSESLRIACPSGFLLNSLLGKQICKSRCSKVCLDHVWHPPVQDTMLMGDHVKMDKFQARPIKRVTDRKTIHTLCLNQYLTAPTVFQRTNVIYPSGHTAAVMVTSQIGITNHLDQCCSEYSGTWSDRLRNVTSDKSYAHASSNLERWKREGREDDMLSYRLVS